jgi:AraC-like DNA-binding protein
MSNPQGLAQHLAVPVFCYLFEALGVSASLCVDGHWAVLHQQPSVTNVEAEHGVLTDRFGYNTRCLERAALEKASVVGEHAGFSDLFTPICADGRARAFLVVGPFLTAPAKSAEILERWRWLTGRQGHPNDPEFSRYVELTLSTLILSGEMWPRFREFVERIAKLFAGEGPVGSIRVEADSMEPVFGGLRRVEIVWDAAREMVDERTGRIWTRPHRRVQRQIIGLDRCPEHVVVGLFVGLHEESDPVEALIKRHAFQRTCVELAHAAGNTISGKIGDQGVFFLTSDAKKPERARRKLLELSRAAASLAHRQYGFRMHLGRSATSEALPAQYQAALAAAESALSKNESVVTESPDVTRGRPLAKLRSELADLAEERPEALPARFDRFLEAVALRSGHRLDPARAHLEAGFERIAEALFESGALEARGIETLISAAERAADQAPTLSELFEGYRRSIRDIVRALERPVVARHDHGLRRAEAYLREHYAEPLDLERVARISGFATSYFSRLFRKKHGTTFVNYLTKLRLERAKELLASTDLSLQRVAALSGISSRHYLNRQFKLWYAQTPIRYRRFEQRVEGTPRKGASRRA